MRERTPFDENRLRRLLQEAVPEDIDSARWDPGETIGRARPLRRADSLTAVRAASGRRPKEALQIPDRFVSGSAPYEVVEEVGRGGMGVVFRVTQSSLGRQVAIKALKGREEDDDTRAAFLSEALINGRLDHPNIVPVYDLVQTDEGRRALAMKMVEGTSWMDLLHPHSDTLRARAAEYPLEKHLEILIAVCNAVAFAHSKGILHRDLKPSNVMLGEYGEILVMDWGMAISYVTDEDEVDDVDARARTKSSVKRPSGSPAYMAPEMTLGDGSRLGPWTDVYLLGAILFEVITGERPHEGESLYEVVKSAYESRPPEFDASVPKELQAICRKAMARRIKDRYQKAEEFQQALREFLTHRESHAIARAASELVEEFKASARPGRTGDYAILPRAIAGFEQAQVLWPGNEAARDSEQHARWLYAQAAFEAKDYRLARTQLTELDGVAATELRRDIVEAEMAQARSVRSLRMLRLGLLVTAGIFLIGLTIGIVVVSRENTRADQNARRAQTALAQVERQRDEIQRQAGRNEQIAREAAANAKRREEEARLKLAALEERERERKRREATEAQAAAAERRAQESDRRADLSEQRAERSADLLRKTAREARAHEARAEEARKQSERDAARADAAARERALALSEARRLADLQLLQRYERDADALVRNKAPKLMDFETWLHRGREVARRLPQHQDALLRVQQAASDRYRGPGRNAADVRDLLRRWEDAEDQRRELERTNAPRRARDLRKSLARLTREMRGLHRRTRASKEYAFKDDDDRLRYEVLRDLVVGIERFSAPSSGTIARVQRHLDMALLGGRYAIERFSREWAETIRGIGRSKRYPKRTYAPQAGLVPLGRDPASQLYEFLHLASHRGPLPHRNARGQVEITEDTGLILVLMPGGKTTLGAQRASRSANRFDAHAAKNETPVHSASLEPFFLSKYEMTQGQWARLRGKNPSHCGPETRFGDRQHSLLHPVEGVSWQACRGLSPFGLELPTEAQWEFAARGGVRWPWWTGQAKGRLVKGANLADTSYGRHGLEPKGVAAESWSDGWAMHAPVGSFAANPFGLHDVLGNVREWCRDGFGGYGLPVRAGDGFRAKAKKNRRVIRGGSFRDAAVGARVTARNHAGAGHADRFTGVRPAMSMRVENSLADQEWQRALREIGRDAAYGRTRMERQSDLMPLGKDPTTGLQEFLHLPSHEGPLPERDGQRRLRVTAKTGIIFVLVPAQKGSLGAQAKDPKATRHDPNARPNEAPVHAVEIAPLLVSKFEMTQGQWLRLLGSNPSQRRAGSRSGPHRVSLAHPVEMVSPQDCERLSVYGLTLPTEAQWELLARAGTTTRWATGNDASSLDGFANLAEAKNRKDGYPHHAPVGTFTANALGLHDMHGNVAELTRDWLAAYTHPVAPKTGARLCGGAQRRTARGGSFQHHPKDARSAARLPVHAKNPQPWLGLRPVRETLRR